MGDAVFCDTILVFVFTVTRCTTEYFQYTQFFGNILFFALKVVGVEPRSGEKKSQVHISVKQKLEIIEKLELVYVWQPYMLSMG